MVVFGILIDEIIKCVNGSTVVLDDGTRTPRRTLRLMFTTGHAIAWSVGVRDGTRPRLRMQVRIDLTTVGQQRWGC